MIRKPPACDSCPARQWGDYYVPDTINPDAEVEIILQNPGEYEEQGLKVTKRIGRNKYETVSVTPQPLIGPTGYDCDTRWFPTSNLDRRQISISNTVRCRMDGTNGLPLATSKQFKDIHHYCQEHHYQRSTKTRLRIACGAYAAASVQCPGPVTDWRGHLLPNSPIPTLITLHPADLNHNPKMGVVMLKDWAKVPRILAGEWPTPLPKIQYFHGTREDEEWFTKAIQMGSISIDTEYTLGTPGEVPTLSLIGLTYPQAETTLSVWWSTEIAQAFTRIYTDVCRKIPIIFWNGIADIPVIEAATGVGYQDYYRIEDAMLKHALLWSELPHTLEFCASVDGKYPKLKHLMSENLALYNQGDVLETLHLNSVYDKELDEDPQTRHVYETQALPLIPILLRSQARGIRVNQQRVVDEIVRQRGILDRASLLAQSATGVEINLGSSTQVQKYLYEEKGYPVQKHYKTKRPTVDQNAINTLRSTHLPVDAEYEEKEGVLYEDIVERIACGASEFLEAMALHSGTRNVVSTYLMGLVAEVYTSLSERDTKRARSTYVDTPPTVDDIITRVYPEYKQHTQANGRWSITNPPMAGMPKSLHHLFIPDEGHCWIKFDFKQIEPRIRACISKDYPRLKDFEQGKDIYQSTCIEMFGKYSPILRKLGKTVELALSYGKQPRNMHHVPGILGYGFKKEDLTRAANNYLREHPQQTSWMESHIKSIRQCGSAREPVGGRCRKLLGYWADQEREGLNQPMQAGAASLTNLTILKIAAACPHAYLVNNRFDEQWWGLPVLYLTQYRKAMIDILSQPWTINGITMVFPVDPPELTVIYP